MADRIAEAFVSAPERSLAPGDVLVTRGDEADDVFLVVNGRVEAINDSTSGAVVVGTIGTGQVIGEITVIAGGRRTATIRAVETTEVKCLRRAEFEGWLIDHPDVADIVSTEARERIDRAHVAAMVAELAGTTDTELIQDVVDRVTWRRLAAGEVLFRQGDPSDAAFFIVGGRVLVQATDGDEPSVAVAELGRGEVVGELGLLDGAPRSATVRAIRDTTLAVFATDTFEELVTRVPGLMLHMARGILTRLRRTPRRLVGRAASIAVVVTAPLDVDEFVGALVAEISKFGSTRYLSSERVDSVLNRSGIAQVEADNVGVPRLAEFLHEADVGNDYVILVTDREMTTWSRRVLRQADRVVVVASARPGVGERRQMAETFDQLADARHVARMLALVHPPGTDRPRGTGATIEEFGADEIAHLRAGSERDTARLARLASGNGVGVVFSGGGARGFAHLGVYRALVESGVPVDAVAGCSMGAPLAAGIALGVPDDQLVEVATQQFHRLLDYTIPVVSLVKGERITNSLTAHFGDSEIEDLWLPFYCVSTNLTRSRLEVHRRGNAVRAIRASTAIPGILPPVPYGDDLLVDGGVLDNMPFGEMRNDGRFDTVVAVNVAPERGPRATGDYGLSVSGTGALLAKVRRRDRGYPGVSAVLLRSMLVGAVHNQRQALEGDAVDLLVRLDLPGVGLLDFERVAEVAEQGYRASLDQVSSWADTLPWLARAT